MKRLLICLGLIATACPEAYALEWFTDVPTAMTRAQKEKKAVLLDFTGSDWCGWCMKLKAEVFDQFAFAGYANTHLIMVEVDFPHRKKLSLEQENANWALASKYGVKGYPTVVLLGADGQLLGRCGYMEGGPSAFIARLEAIIGRPNSTPNTPPAPAVSAKAAPAGVGIQAPAPAPPPYGDLTLKGLSGSGSRRLALINNQTFTAGETASVKIFDSSVQVTVKEIREASVLIEVKGATRELKLARQSPPRE